MEIREVVVNGNLMRQVYGYSRYAVNRIGVIWDFKRGKMLDPHGADGEYRYIRLVGDNGDRKNWLHHRFVAVAWVDNPHRRNEVNHINGRKSDNYAENLEWVTHRENIRHAHAMGLVKVRSGEGHHQYGKPIPNATKAKMREAKVGERHPRFKGWYLTPLGRFESLEEAGAAHGMSSVAMYKRFKKLAYKPLDGWGFEACSPERHKWMDSVEPEKKDRLPLSDEARSVMRDSKIGVLNPMFKGVYVTDLGRFNSLEDAGAAHGVHKTTMMRRFKNGTNGYVFIEK